MTGKQTPVIPGIYRQHILAGIIIAGQQHVSIDTHGGGTEPPNHGGGACGFPSDRPSRGGPEPFRAGATGRPLRFLGAAGDEDSLERLEQPNALVALLVVEKGGDPRDERRGAFAGERRAGPPRAEE